MCYKFWPHNWANITFCQSGSAVLHLKSKALNSYISSVPPTEEYLVPVEVEQLDSEAIPLEAETFESEARNVNNMKNFGNRLADYETEDAMNLNKLEEAPFSYRTEFLRQSDASETVPPSTEVPTASSSPDDNTVRCIPKVMQVKIGRAHV